MSAERKKTSWFRSVAAVLGGYLTAVILTMVMFPVLMFLAPDSFSIEEERIDPPWSVVVVVLGFVWAVIAGFVTAVIANGAEIAHALALMGIFLAMWIVFVVSAPAEQSTWYQNGLQLGGVFGALAGGVLRAVQVSMQP